MIGLFIVATLGVLCSAGLASTAEETERRKERSVGKKRISRKKYR